MPVELGNNGSQLMLSPCLHTDTQSGYPISIPELGTRSQLMLLPYLESGADRRYMGLCGGLLAQVWPDTFQQYSLSTPVSRFLCV